MDGPWQTGHKTAEEYGRLAAETARAMRQIDPAVELVACGSSSQSMPTFAAWEATVLAGDVRPRRLHLPARLLRGPTTATSTPSWPPPSTWSRFIENVVATCDHVGARLKSKKKINLSFDEWNVWYQDGTRPKPHAGEDWAEAPRLLEDDYTVTDAVVFGSLLIALLRHADRVTVACLAQLVNVIAPIMTEPGGPAWRQTTFFPFAQASTYGRGKVLDVGWTPRRTRRRSTASGPLLHATAVRADGRHGHRLRRQPQPDRGAAARSRPERARR